MLKSLRPVNTVVKSLSFSHKNYDELSKEDAVVYYKGELGDGSLLEVEIVYPKREKLDFYVRVDDKDLLHGPHQEMKDFCLTGTLSEFIQLKLEEYESERKGESKKKKKDKKGDNNVKKTHRRRSNSSKRRKV